MNDVLGIGGGRGEKVGDEVAGEGVVVSAPSVVDATGEEVGTTTGALVGLDVVGDGPPGQPKEAGGSELRQQTLSRIQS